MLGEAALLSVAPDDRERTVVACGLDVRQLARLYDALRRRATVRDVRTFEELSQVLRTRPEYADCVVLAARDPAGQDAAGAVQEITTAWPRTAVIAYCRAGLQHSADLRALAIAGVHQFVFDGIDDTGVAFRTVLDAGRQTCAAEWLMRHIGPLFPPVLHPMLEAGLAKANEITTVTQLAYKLCLTRTTLFNRCVRAGSLMPEELLVWTRLAVVAFYLETTGCTIESIAYQVGFASDNALRNTMKRYTGLTASQVRASGGVARVVLALKSRLARREQKRAALTQSNGVQVGASLG